MNTEPMVAVCAWCPDARIKTADAIARGLNVTHTICPDCAKKFESDQK